MITHRAVGAAVVTVLVLLVGPAAASSRPDSALAHIAAVEPTLAARLHLYSSLLRPAEAVTRPLPAHPQAALATAATELSDLLGFHQLAGPRIQAAQLPPLVAGRLAILLEQVRRCHAITVRYRDELFRRMPDLFRDRYGLKRTDFPEVLPCAVDLWRATGELELTIRTALGVAQPDGCRPMPGRTLDIWPVLRVEPGCENNTYRNDYLLVVDIGGADTYANNVGANVVDLNFAPIGAAVAGFQGTGPAKGCQRGLAGLGRDDCYVSAAVLLDLHGSDAFGVLESPDSDALCTREPVVRRMVTAGAGVLGVGILRDGGLSDDRYLGKTVSLGAGHVFGVGILSDAGGDDTYLSVRNSQGYGLVAGLGILRDAGGDDRYRYYMPAPIDPSAPNQTDGAGGVRDNEGDGYCDHMPRYTLGAANLSSVAIFIDDSGDDSYHGAYSDFYTTNPSIPGMLVTGGALGYGGNDGLAVFLDGGGHDSYRVDNLPAGLPVRADGTVIRPGGAATDAFGTGLFIDRQ